LHSDSNFDDYLTQINERWRGSSSEEEAKSIWATFIDRWNKARGETIEEVSDYIDTYASVYIKDPKITYKNNDFNVSDVLKGTEGNQLPKAQRQIIKKKIIGMSNLSSVWREYSDSYMHAALDKDLSSTSNEIQLIGWGLALFIRDEKGKHPDTSFSSDYTDYFRSMVFGLELYLMMRASLQILESRIQEVESEFFDGQIQLRNLLNPLNTLKYQSNIRDFDHWIAELKEWEYLDRHGLIRHFHDFLQSGYTNLRIESWLNETEEKINHLRKSHDVRSNRISTFNSIFLTILLLIFTILAFASTVTG
jgi:hypothetical protein